MTIETGNLEDMQSSLSERIESLPDSDFALTEPVRVRISSDAETELNKIEAHFRGRGFRHVTRSHLVRIALQDFVEDIHTSNPEIFE
jgi:hypothetical protein